MSLLDVGKLAYAAYSGADAIVEALARYGVKLALRSRAVDDQVGQDMVDAMRADAPQLTGNLVNGITWRAEDDATIVTASALRTSGGVEWDYAPFTEHGTSRETAEPFFYSDAEQVLADRGTSLENASAAAADDSGF